MYVLKKLWSPASSWKIYPCRKIALALSMRHPVGYVAFGTERFTHSNITFHGNFLWFDVTCVMLWHFLLINTSTLCLPLAATRLLKNYSIIETYIHLNMYTLVWFWVTFVGHLCDLSHCDLILLIICDSLSLQTVWCDRWYIISLSWGCAFLISSCVLVGCISPDSCILIRECTCIKLTHSVDILQVTCYIL